MSSEPKSDLQRGSFGRVRFSLAAVFEYMTLCALLSALSTRSGIIASVFLMAMALAIGARQGLIALGMFMAASLVAESQLTSIDRGSPFARQVTVILLAGLICAWYLVRTMAFGPSTASQEKLTPTRHASPCD